jgi:O-antigen/teichoic acid export membrane protein
MVSKDRAFSGVRSDFLVAISASASVAVVSLFLFGWIGRTMGADELGFFSQIRRVAAMWVPIGTVGLGLALGRFTPRLSDLALVRRRSLQVFAAVLLILAAHGAVAPLLLESGVLEPVIGKRSGLLWPLVWQVAGLCSLILPFALLRGLHRFRWAAALQVFGYALWPLAVTAAMIDGPLEALIRVIGQGQSILGCTAMLGLSLIPRPAKTPPEGLPAEGLRIWIIYSLLRLPAGALGFMLWTGLPMILIAWGKAADVALANAVISLVNIPLLILSPLAFVLLPRLSLAQAQGEDQEVEQFLRRGLRAIWELQWPLTFSLVLFLGPLLELWLGFSSASFLFAGQWMVAAIPAVSLFLFLRPALDARAVIPFAVIAQAIGLSLSALWLWLSSADQNVVQLGGAFFVAHTLSAGIASLYCFRIHHISAKLPLARVGLQTLPLALGAGLFLWLGTNLSGILVWFVALIGYVLVLQRSGSPVTEALIGIINRRRT